MTLTLCVVGGPNYAQFGNRLHAGGGDVRAEADHVDGVNDLLVGCGRLERRDESGRVVSGANLTARAKTGGRRTCEGEAAYGEGKEQRKIRLDSPTASEEDQGRCMTTALTRVPKR